MDLERQFLPETLLLHAGQQIGSSSKSSEFPEYQTTSYVFNHTHGGVESGDFAGLGDTYIRLMNPITDLLEQRIAVLEGGIGALALASGQSAVTLAVLTLAHCGDEIVSSGDLSPGTYSLFNYTLPTFGIKVHFVDPKDPQNFRRALNERTRAVFAETVGNSRLDTLDVEAVAQAAHEHGVPLIVDNTIATPYLVNPIAHGADIVIHSATKFISGQSTSVGGIIVDSGNFAWDNAKYPQLSTPDPQYVGLNFSTDLGKMAYIIKMRVQLLREEGPALSAFNSFMLLQGLETLHLRMERHSENALQIAQFLRSHPKVAWVDYPGLCSRPNYQLNQKYYQKGWFGALIGFGLCGGAAQGKKLIKHLCVHSVLANIGGTKSIAMTYPATRDLVRLSVGIENAQDIIYDLDQALSKL